MKMDNQLNLVIPIYKDDGFEVVAGYVYAAPIPRDVFEAYYRLIAGTFTALMQDGHGELSGTKVAALTLREVALNKKLDPAPLLNELQRRTMFHGNADGLWDAMPLYTAAARGLISDDDLAEVMNQLVYFTAASVMLPRQIKADILTGAAKLSGADVTSLPFTVWIGSLPTSTVTADLGEPLATDTGFNIRVNRPS